MIALRNIMRFFQDDEPPEITYIVVDSGTLTLQKMTPTLPMPEKPELDRLFAELVVSIAHLLYAIRIPPIMHNVHNIIHIFTHNVIIFYSGSLFAALSLGTSFQLFESYANN